MHAPEVTSFFDEATNSWTHVAVDPATRHAAVFDPVLGFDAASGRIDHAAADIVLAFVERERLTVDWIVETHVHADHLTAAPYLRARCGGRVGIGEHVESVRSAFAHLFPPAAGDGDGFDHRFTDGENWHIGSLEARVMHTPGHTPACTTHVVGDAAFVGDTLFMPDYGTARCDFPGGDARTLYRSIRRVLDLPAETRLFLCHDYKAPGRDRFVGETTVAAERTGNVHVRDGVDEDAFVAMRTARDATLAVPKLMLPSVQVNLRAGRLPEPAANGVRYLQLPLDAG